MPEQIFASSLIIAAGIAGLAFGASGSTVVYIAPAAFDRLDYRRADSLVRKVVKGILPWIAGMAAGAAVFAILGTAIGAGAVLIVAAGCLYLVRWVLDPLPKKARMAGAVRKQSQQRILALQVMFVVILLFPIAIVALAFGI